MRVSQNAFPLGVNAALYDVKRSLADQREAAECREDARAGGCLLLRTILTNIELQTCRSFWKRLRDKCSSLQYGTLFITICIRGIQRRLLLRSLTLLRSSYVTSSQARWAQILLPLAARLPFAAIQGLSRLSRIYEVLSFPTNITATKRHAFTSIMTFGGAAALYNWQITQKFVSFLVLRGFVVMLCGHVKESKRETFLRLLDETSGRLDLSRLVDALDHARVSISIRQRQYVFRKIKTLQRVAQTPRFDRDPECTYLASKAAGSVLSHVREALIRVERNLDSKRRPRS